MPLRTDVAILLFTRSAGEEARHKQFVSHGLPDRNASVAAQLIRHTQDIAAQAGVDVVCMDSVRQYGTTFGTRLTGAMEHVFGLGYQQILVIGNDCPELDTRLLRSAIAALRHGRAVLGPATDGGVYLLGISRHCFEQASWQHLPWQTSHLGVALQRQLRNVPLELLPLLADVDNEQDLARALRRPVPRVVRRRLRRLRAAAPPLRVSFACRVRRRSVAPQPHRGPPAS